MRVIGGRRILSVLVLVAVVWLPAGPARAVFGDEIIVTNNGTHSIVVYTRTANGDVAPVRTLQGPATGILGPVSVAVDPVHGELVVDHAAVTPTVATFPLLADGNVAPLRSLSDLVSLNPRQLVIDIVHDELIVENVAYESVLFYARAASGSAAPLRVISGPATGIGPNGMAVDFLHDEIFVGDSLTTSIVVHARTATGNVPPLRTIVRPELGCGGLLGLAVDVVHDEVLVADSACQSITVFARTANGPATPLRTIQGAATGLINPAAVLVDLVHDEILVSNAASPYAITVYPRAASGNVVPLRTIQGPLTGLSSPRGLALLAPPPLLVVPGVGGTVTSAPGGVSCPPDCAEGYSTGTVVTLTATPDLGSLFTGWGGACSGTGDCVVQMDLARTVTVGFSTPDGLLTVSLTGAGTGTVTSVPPGIACPPDCSETFGPGMVVQLVPTPDGAASFLGWTGASDCGDGVVTLTVAITCTASFGPAPATVVSLASPGLGGQPPDGASLHPSISADGARIVFESSAINLVASGCTTSTFPFQVFLRLRGVPTVDGGTRCLSVSPTGAPGNGPSHHPRISGDGLVVAFDSEATNLVAGGSVVPLAAARGRAAGARAATSACATGVAQVFVRLVLTGVTECVSVGVEGAPGNGPSRQPAISRDGRFVAFESAATNLVAAGCTSGGPHVFVRDRLTGVTTCASVDGGGAPGNGASRTAALSGDGAAVAFSSLATNLAAPCVTGTEQVFLRAAGITTCVSVGPGAVAGDGPSRAPSLSGDGHRVAFEADAGNLVPSCATGTTQVYVLDRALGLLVCSSVGPDGAPGDGPSTEPALSGHGLILAFTSAATNLVVGAPGAGPAPALRGAAVPRAAAVQTHIGPANVSTGSVQTAWQALLGVAGGGGGGSSSSSQAQTTAGGQTMVATTAGGVMVVQQVPPPPSGRPLLLEPAPLTEFPLGLPLVLRVRWTAVANADHYRLEVRGPDQAFATPPNGNAFDHAALAVELPGLEASIPDLSALDPPPPPGTYRIRVIGLAQDGNPGTSTFSDELPVLLRPGTGASIPTATDRPYLVIPADGSTVARGQAVTLAWTALTGVTVYGVEVSGPDCAFTTTALLQDPCGFGGTGGGGLVTGTTVTLTVPPNTPPGAYQLRVIGANAAVTAAVGQFSDPITVHVP